MTRQELIKKLVRKERKGISYTFAQVTSTLASMSPAEKQSLADAINADDKVLLADILFTFFDVKKDADALASVNAKITNDKIDIDDIADALDDNPRNNQKT